MFETMFGKKILSFTTERIFACSISFFYNCKVEIEYNSTSCYFQSEAHLAAHSTLIQQLTSIWDKESTAPF